MVSRREQRQAELARQEQEGAAARKQEKAKMSALFKQSVRDYKAGHLEQAREGFQRVVDSGISLSLFD